MPIVGEDVMILGGINAGFTTILSALVALPPKLRALTVKLDVPAAVGVPVIAPVLLLSFKPAGREPAVMVQTMGVWPVAARVWL